MIARRLIDFPGFDFDELHRLRRRIDALARGQRPGAGVFPALNVTETAESFRVRAELPGLSKDDIEISVDGQQLSIAGERQIAPESENSRYHRRERAAGRFSRVVNLPADVETSEVTARYELGVLTIELPKAEAARPRTITIDG